MKKNVFRWIVACLVSFSVLTGITLTASADEQKAENDEIVPTIEVQKDGWLIVSYGQEVKDKFSAVKELDAYVASALRKMNSNIEKQRLLRSGSNYMEDDAEQNYGNGYVRGWFGTHTSWSSSPADFWGSSSAAWFGTSPSSTCDIGTEHLLTPPYMEGYIQQVPSGWSNFIYYTGSGMYFSWDDWYLGTAWSGLKCSYGSQIAIDQASSMVFDFDVAGNDPSVFPSDSMYYGE
jgi:hypothetical protein